MRLKTREASLYKCVWYFLSIVLYYWKEKADFYKEKQLSNEFLFKKFIEFSFSFKYNLLNSNSEHCSDYRNAEGWSLENRNRYWRYFYRPSLYR